MSSFKKLATDLKLPPLLTEWAVYLDTTHTILGLMYPDLTDDELVAIGNRVIINFMRQGIYPKDGMEAVKLLFSEVVNRIGWPETFKPYVQKEANDVSDKKDDSIGDKVPV